MTTSNAAALAEQLAQLASWLAGTGIGYLELRGPDVDCRLVQHHGHVEAAPAGYQPRLAAAALTVTAPSVGRVRLAHPQHVAPLVEPGQTVHAGQMLALLEIGTLLLPVTAPCDGHVADIHMADRAVVGYGDSLLELVPATPFGSDRPLPETL